METHAPVLDHVGLDERKQPQQNRPGGADCDGHCQGTQEVIPPARAKANRERKRSDDGGHALKQHHDVDAGHRTGKGLDPPEQVNGQGQSTRQWRSYYPKRSKDPGTRCSGPWHA